MKKFVNILTFITICSYISACEEGGGSAQPSTGNTSIVDGNFIPDEVSQLGSIAQYLIQNDLTFNEYYYAVQAGDGQKMYADSQIVFALRSYINAKASPVNGNGTADVLNEDGYTVFIETVAVPTGSSRGLDRNGLCHMSAVILESFTIPTTIVYVSGANHAHAPGGNYCVVEAELPNGNFMFDPYLNRSWGDVSNSWLTVDQIAELVSSNNTGGMYANPDGHGNAKAQWAPLMGYYQSYESISNANAEQEDQAREAIDLTFETINKVAFEDL